MDGLFSSSRERGAVRVVSPPTMSKFDSLKNQLREHPEEVDFSRFDFQESDWPTVYQIIHETKSISLFQYAYQATKRQVPFAFLRRFFKGTDSERSQDPFRREVMRHCFAANRSERLSDRNLRALNQSFPPKYRRGIELSVCRRVIAFLDGVPECEESAGNCAICYTTYKKLVPRLKHFLQKRQYLIIEIPALAKSPSMSVVPFLYIGNSMGIRTKIEYPNDSKAETPAESDPDPDSSILDEFAQGKSVSAFDLFQQWDKQRAEELATHQCELDLNMFIRSVAHQQSLSPIVQQTHYDPHLFPIDKAAVVRACAWEQVPLDRVEAALDAFYFSYHLSL